MRKLIYAALGLALATPATAAQYSIYASNPQAGQPIRWTVNRVNASQAATVVMSTKDNTAKVNIDYLYSSVMIQFAPQQISATILVPTIVSPAAAGQTLKVGLVLSEGGTPVASMLASIIEPAAPPPPPPPPPPTDPRLIYNPCFDTNGPIIKSWCPAKSCPGNPSVPVELPCPVVTSILLTPSKSAPL